MARPPTAWRARIEVRRPTVREAERLRRTLAPEAAREVAKVQTALRREDGSTVVLAFDAEETGSLRAAINTYLGWIRLTLEAEGVAHPPPVNAPPAAGGEALI